MLQRLQIVAKPRLGSLTNTNLQPSSGGPSDVPVADRSVIGIPAFIILRVLWKLGTRLGRPPDPPK